MDGLPWSRLGIFEKLDCQTVYKSFYIMGAVKAVSRFLTYQDCKLVHEVSQSNKRLEVNVIKQRKALIQFNFKELSLCLLGKKRL